jgi:hypothetical protein
MEKDDSLQLLDWMTEPTSGCYYLEGEYQDEGAFVDTYRQPTPLNAIQIKKLAEVRNEMLHRVERAWRMSELSEPWRLAVSGLQGVREGRPCYPIEIQRVGAELLLAIFEKFEQLEYPRCDYLRKQYIDIIEGILGRNAGKVEQIWKVISDRIFKARKIGVVRAVYFWIIKTNIGLRRDKCS